MKMRNIITIPINGYKAMFELMRGNVDEAYKLTHLPKKRENKKIEKQAKTFNCPGCNKLLNDKVRKCVCGMEFK